MGPAPSRSVIVPVRNGATTLNRCLDAIRRSSLADFELIVVDDHSKDDSPIIATAHGVRLLDSPGYGPAAARNHGAEHALGKILLFVDADCEVHEDALARLAAVLDSDPDHDAAFGSYDDQPAQQGVLTELKNLQHHFVHQHARRESASFWGACSAIRRDAFLAAGGFDSAAYPQPSIEDIELGGRLAEGGHRTLLVAEALVTHHKRWTLRNLAATDLLRRAVPWTRLMLRGSGLTRDLNLDSGARLSAAALLAAALFAALALATSRMMFLPAGAAALVIFVAANAAFYRFLAARRPLGFVLAAVPLHAGYYCIALLGFSLGVVAAAGERLRERGPDGRPVPLAARITATPVLELLTAAIAAAFPVAQLLRSRPWLDDAAGMLARDDWAIYRANAISILHDGLSMPARHGPYVRPAGFLYNYFVAAIFALFGENDCWVYLVQAALLGLATAAMLLGFRRWLSPRATAILMLLLAATATLDIFRPYTHLLLSENLLVAIVPSMLLLVIRAGSSGSPAVAALAGAVSAAAFLARPNTILAGPIFALLILARAPRRKLAATAAFVAIWLSVAALLPLRNAVVTGEPTITAVTSTHDWMQPRSRERQTGAALAWARQLTRHILFVLGWTPVENPGFRPRPHWLILWTGVFLLLIDRIRRRWIEWWEVVLFAFTVAYLGPIIAIAAIGNYGFRAVIPILGVAAVLAARGYDLLPAADRRPSLSGQPR